MLLRFLPVSLILTGITAVSLHGYRMLASQLSIISQGSATRAGQAVEGLGCKAPRCRAYLNETKAEFTGLEQAYASVLE